MAKTGTAIVKVNIQELVEHLNKALADEWLAYYQYWIGAKVVKGPFSLDASKEFAEHAEEEFKHAGMLVDRIIQLGGTPLLNPNQWSKASTCGYAEPKSCSDKELLEQNIKGERCAIGVYDKLLKLTRDKDDVTYSLLLEILKDEIEHEQDLENLLYMLK